MCINNHNSGYLGMAVQLHMYKLREGWKEVEITCRQIAESAKFFVSSQQFSQSDLWWSIPCHRVAVEYIVELFLS